ncbi:hypothetical protein EVAR_101113_1 [Eumeta japonica]|uniref:Uncharacterized protein n=1 Tax=Eumeta variegata TaxID=151549 RepID=A0A4C2A765_EUMVA|nr:hypothetical protein EVAR_101113_1 [Eumeta japonica]
MLNENRKLINERIVAGNSGASPSQRLAGGRCLHGGLFLARARNRRAAGSGTTYIPVSYAGVAPIVFRYETDYSSLAIREVRKHSPSCITNLERRTVQLPLFDLAGGRGAAHVTVLLQCRRSSDLCRGTVTAAR